MSRINISALLLQQAYKVPDGLTPDQFLVQYHEELRRNFYSSGCSVVFQKKDGKDVFTIQPGTS